MHPYPGIDELGSNLMVSRTVGGADSQEHLGGGFMRKDGGRGDEVNRTYGFYVLVYVIRGTGTYVTPNGDHRRLRAGSAFQRFPNVSHSSLVDPGSDWREFYLSIGPQTYHALRTMRIIRDERFVYDIEPDPALETRAYNLVKNLADAEESLLPGLLLTQLEFLTDVLKRCHGTTEEEEIGRMVNEACTYFGKAYDQRIDLREYCRENGWGYERFRKVFKERVGISPGRYVVRRRMEMACQLLLKDRRPIAEIAEQLGYGTPFEFSSHFKRCVGCPPRHYRHS